MVEISDITEIPASEERFLDAKEIEEIIEKTVERPSVKAHLQALAQKIRRDGNAIQRLEDSKRCADLQAMNKSQGDNEDSEQQPKDETSQDKDVVDKPQDDEQAQVKAQSQTAPTEPTEPIKEPAQSAVSASASVPTSRATAQAPIFTSSLKYKSIDRFSFDAGGYNSPTVSIYISLPNIGSIPNKKEQVKCTFASESFDLTIHDFDGVNYRLLKDNLDKSIDAEKSKCLVKSNKIILKLHKIKTDYGSYDTWTDLSSKKGKETKKKGKSGSSTDPSASIMELMKDMYDSGDDNMKKIIGETMLKQREGKLPDGVEDDKNKFDV